MAEHVEQPELSYNVHGNIKWYYCFGNISPANGSAHSLGCVFTVSAHFLPLALSTPSTAHGSTFRFELHTLLKLEPAPLGRD